MVDVNDGSILDEIKKMLGFESDYIVFDTDITIHINSVFSVLDQLGVGPLDGFWITDNTAKWSDFIGNAKHVQMIKSLVYIQVRLIFDPPASSFAQTALQEKAKELESRLNYLELEFNPHAYDTPLDGLEATTWEIVDNEGFPPEAQPGDTGVDLTTGSFWRKT